MLRRITCAGFMSIASLLFAQAAAVDEYGPPLPPPAPATPVIACLESSFDWGEVIEGDTVEHTYEILNQGGALLRIDEVKTTCGCTSTKFDKEIAPGGKGVVVLQLRSRGYTGAIKKTVQVASNDPATKLLPLTLGGTVRPPVKYEPDKPAIEGLRGEALSTTVKIIRNVPDPIKIVSVKALPTSRITPEFVETKPGEEFDLKLTLNTQEKASTASAYDRLTVMVQIGEKLVESTLNLRIKLVDTITAMPTYITFRAYELDAFNKNPASIKPSRSVVLKSWQNKPFKVTALDIKTRRFSVTPNEQGQPMEPPVAAVLEGDPATGECKVKIDAIKFADEESMGRPVRSELTIKTDDAATPEIVIPVTVYFPVKNQPAAAGQGLSPYAPRVPPANPAAQSMGSVPRMFSPTAQRTPPTPSPAPAKTTPPAPPAK